MAPQLGIASLEVGRPEPWGNLGVTHVDRFRFPLLSVNTDSLDVSSYQCRVGIAAASMFPYE